MINGSIAQDPAVPHTAQDPFIADTICISPVISLPLLSLARCPATRKVNSSLACMARPPSVPRPRDSCPRHTGLAVRVVRG